MPRSAVSDGLRVVHLKPGAVDGYICYLQALNAAGYMDKLSIVSARFYALFPMHRQKLKKTLQQCMYVCAFVYACT